MIEKTPEEKRLAALFGGHVSHREEVKLDPEIEIVEDSKALEEAAYLDKWKHFCHQKDTNKLKASLHKHLNILAETDECSDLLKDILDHVNMVDIVDGRLTISFITAANEMVKLVCFAPNVKENDIWLDSYKDIFSVHGGFSFPGVGKEAFPVNLSISAPIFLNGPDISTMFSPETPDEEDLLIAIDTHQDWFVMSKDKLAANNKPLITFLSHDSSEEDIISDDYSVGGHYLRLIALTILDSEDKRLSRFRCF